MSSLLTAAGSGGGMLSLVTPHGKVPGTGLLKVSKLMASLTGGHSNPALMNQVLGELPSLFGDYPSHEDIAPCGLFIAIFSVFALAHFYIFGKNYTRGQSFWPSFGLAMYCVMRTIGWGLRLKWSRDIMNVNVGVASAVFCIVPVVYVSVVNMLFGHRIFTWRHPETGEAKWFNIMMLNTYLVVVGVIVMGILGQSIPYIYFLDQHHLDMCRRVTQAAAILQVLYSVSGLVLILFAYVFKPGTIDHKFCRFYKHGDKVELPATFSPTWIQKTSIFYFPQKGSQIPIYKDSPESHAIRVIANEKPPAGGLSRHQSGEHCGGPKMRTAIILIAIASVLLTISSSFRTASTFNITRRGGVNGQPLSSWVYHKWLMYFFFGFFEVVINILYLVMRADLRFYIPDAPRKRTDGSHPYHQTNPDAYDIEKVQSNSFDQNSFKPEATHLDSSVSPNPNTFNPPSTTAAPHQTLNPDPMYVPRTEKKF